MNLYRVITWTEKDGVTSVSEPLSYTEAVSMAKTIREANPSYVGVEIEKV